MAPGTATAGPLRVSHRQVGTEFLAAGLACEKPDGQPLEVLMGLWKLLCPDGCYNPLPPKQVQASAVADRELAPYVLTDFLPN